ncbi:hypothetical protein [Luteimonas sp. SDU101]|uniref:hypothetical protein n=1 Tax=Luteimonas sp. SDU101 TaxID=3422593 RepID=UPI003EBF66C5
MAASALACAATGAGAQEARRGQASASAQDGTLTLAERQAAWSAHKGEYRRRLLRDGQASADRWLDDQVLASRAVQPAPAATPGPPTEPPRAGKQPKGTKNCKKIRWVNRATPGFGGSGMTMSRVPVCDD